MHIRNKHWLQVFLLVSGRLKNADGLLLAIKKQIDLLTGVDEKLQKYLEWNSKQSVGVPTALKPAVVRGLYHILNHAGDYQEYYLRLRIPCCCLSLRLKSVSSRCSR